MPRGESRAGPELAPVPALGIAQQGGRPGRRVRAGPTASALMGTCVVPKPQVREGNQPGSPEQPDTASC